MFSAEHKKVVVLSALGGAIEFYDFIVFIFFANILSQLFFPLKDPTASLMATFAVFAVGYFARPLGGIVFGHLGDRLGRKITFITTVIMMAIPTFIIGCLPAYNHVGLFASIALIILRIMQGFSVGGEIPGAIVFASETVAKEHRGLACGIIFFGINMGMVFGSFVTSLLIHFLSTAQLHSWGWRVPFWLGGVMGVISFYLRRQMRETTFFQNLQSSKKMIVFPLFAILKEYPKQVLQGFILTGLQAIVISLFFLYLPIYLVKTFQFPNDALLLMNTINILVFSTCILFASHLSDLYGRKIVMRIGVLFLLLFSYPLFMRFQTQHFSEVIVVALLFSVFVSCITSCFAPMLAELYPTKIRYSGVAVSYNFGFILGGLTPLISTELLERTHNLFAPTFYLIAMAFVVFITLFFVPETARVPLTK